MSVVRVNKTKDYTVLSNFHLRDKQLSLKAKGLLSVMLSLPDNWNYTIEGLTTICKEGKDSIAKVLNELEEYSYLIRTRLTNDLGQFQGYNYDIFEQPIHNGKNPFPENPDTDNPNTENPTQLNTNIYNTNKLNTNNKESMSKDIHKEKLENDINEVIVYLREATNKDFRLSSKSTRKFIGARLNDGYTVSDLKKVIDLKTRQWQHTSMEKYLRPETLFNETKFSSYISECPREEDDRTYGVYV